LIGIDVAGVSMSMPLQIIYIMTLVVTCSLFRI
jgi:hypothetical protein